MLLPEDPDASASRIREAVAKSTGVRPGVIVSDSMNRPWRLGTIGGAIGSAGIAVLDDRRGLHDIYGREMKVTLINRADSIATAATLVMGETTEKTPAALVRGFPQEDSRRRRATSSDRSKKTCSADMDSAPQVTSDAGFVGTRFGTVAR